MSAEREPLLRDGDADREDQVTHTSRFRNGKFTPLEKVLIALAAIFFVTLCVLTGLYTRRIYDEKPDGPPGTVPAPPGDNDSTPICLTPECVLTAAQILKDIDTTLDPCEDFYQYTCNNWQKTHQIPEGTSSTNSFVLLSDQNKEALRNILSGTFEDFYDRTHSSEASRLPDPEKVIDKQNFNKAKNLYDSCMNEAKIDSRGAEPIYPLIKELQDLFPTKRGDQSESRTLTETLAFLAKKQIGSPFEFMIDADPKDPTVNAITLYQSGLSLPSKEYYEQEDSVKLLREAIEETLEAVFSKSEDFGWGKNSAATTAKLVVDFEKKLADKSDFNEYFQDPERIYNLLSLSELAKAAPAVDWGLYVNRLTPATAPHPGKIIVTSPAYVGNVSKLFESENTRTLQAYFTWQVVSSYADALGDEVRAPLRRFGAKLTGADPKAVKPRWKTCLSEIDNSLGFLAGRYYVIDKFGVSTKKRADDFVNSIKEVFLARLPELTWLDDVTRERAVEKVNSLTRKIGYPDSSPNVMSPVSLSGYYGDLSIDADDFFGNYLNSREFDNAKSWSDVGKTPDPARWGMYPQVVNAYYNPTVNEIVFPAGILQNPFFGDNYPDYLNYGGIGVVVGHELTHGYDNNGRHYDGAGRLVEWWTDATAAKFDEKAQCFIDQYSNFTTIGEKGEKIHVNGRLTLGENLADNGGLGEAYSAWKQRYDSDKESRVYNNVRLPGLDGLTPEQLFFVNFGRVWCNNITPAAYKRQVLVDEHSPGRWRVNGAIQNSKIFAEAFNCPAGSPMNPVNKCELW